MKARNMTLAVYRGNNKYIQNLVDKPHEERILTTPIWNNNIKMDVRS